MRTGGEGGQVVAQTLPGKRAERKQMFEMMKEGGRLALARLAAGREADGWLITWICCQASLAGQEMATGDGKTFPLSALIAAAETQRRSPVRGRSDLWESWKHGRVLAA